MLQLVTRKQRNECFVTLNDVLVYINNANQTTKRCIQIALNNRINIHAVNPVPVKASVKSKKYFWKFKFYFLHTFRANSLSSKNMEIVFNYCDQYGYDIKHIQFERISFNSFKMWYCGDDRTYMFYEIGTNEVVGG